MDSSTLPSTSTLGGVDSQSHALAALPPGKTRYPLYRRLSGPQGRSGRVRKISPPPAFDPRTVQPVANRYTDCPIPTPNASRSLHNNFVTWIPTLNKHTCDNEVTGLWKSTNSTRRRYLQLRAGSTRSMDRTAQWGARGSYPSTDVGMIRSMRFRLSEHVAQTGKIMNTKP
jgi:hypothetical protein